MRIFQEQVIAGMFFATLLALGLLLADEHELARSVQNPLFKVSGTPVLAATGNQVNWSADGKTLMVVARNCDGAAHRLSIHQLGGQGYVPSWSEMLKDSFNHATLSPDGKSIVVATCSGELWWIDLETAAATELVTLAPKIPFSASAISRNGRLIAGATADGTIYLCDPKLGISKTLSHSFGYETCTLDFSNDGQRILRLRTDGVAEVWTTDTGELLSEIGSPRRYIVAAAAFLPDGSGVIGMTEDRGLRIWDIASNAERWRGFQGAFGSNGIVALDVVSNGSLVAWGDGLSRRIVIWDLENQRIKYEIENPSMLMNLKFSPDGNLLAVAGLEHIVRVYDINTGKEMHRIDVKQIHETKVRT